MTDAEKEKELACEIEKHRAQFQAATHALGELVDVREMILSVLTKAIARLEDEHDTEDELLKDAKEKYWDFYWGRKRNG